MENTGSSSSSGFLDKNIFSFDSVDSYEELPCSGYNVVYRVKRHGRWYVLKGLKEEYRKDALYLQLLRKEFDLTCQLDHPNIVHVFDLLPDDSVVGVCLLEEYVNGVRLDEFLESKPTEAVRLRLIDQLLDAMAYFHSMQMVHRDLKPSNVLVTRNGSNVKIIDFGLSDADNFAIFKQPAGSAKYAAPEQMKADGPIDNRTDIYAFGKLLQLVFPGRYKRIARKCVSVKPADRYQSVEEIQADLHRNYRLYWLSAFLLVMVLSLVAFYNVISRNGQQRVESTSTDSPSEVKPVHDTLVRNNTDTVLVPATPTIQHDVQIDTIVRNHVDTVNVYSYTPTEQAVFDGAKKYLDSVYNAFKRQIGTPKKRGQEIFITDLYKLHFEQTIAVRNRYASSLHQNTPAYNIFMSTWKTYEEELYLGCYRLASKLPWAYDLYKQGEISEEEYERQKEYLQKYNSAH